MRDEIPQRRWALTLCADFLVSSESSALLGRDGGANVVRIRGAA